MSRTLSAALIGRKSSWVLGAGLAVALIAGCGSQGDSGGDNGGAVGTGGGGYVYPQGGAGVNTGGGGGVIYLTSTTGGRSNTVIGTGGRTGVNPQGGNGGATAATGGASVASTCVTGTLNCPCYSPSGACGGGLICNNAATNPKCIVDTSVGGSTGTGGSKASGGATSTAAGGTAAVGGATTVGGTAATTLGGTTTAGGATTTAGGATTATGGATRATGGATAATGGATAATGGATAATGGATAATGGATGAGGSTGVATCSNATTLVDNPNGSYACTANCEVKADVTVGTAVGSVKYGCTCTSEHLVCIATNNSTYSGYKACPVGVATHTSGQQVDCTPASDSNCALDLTLGVNTTTHLCTCDIGSNKWIGSLCYSS